jgi:O-antigen ligase
MSSARIDALPLASGTTEASRLSRAALFAFAAGLPLNVMVATRLGSTSAALGIPLAVAAVWQVLSVGRLRRLSAPLLWMLAFTALSAVAIFWAIDVFWFEVQVKTRAQLLAFLLLAWQIARSERDVHALLGGYLVGCFVTVAEVWRSFASLGDAGERGIGRWVAAGLDPNDMATTLAMGIPIAGFIALRRARWWHVLALAYIPLGGSGIALSASRGGAITAGAGALWLLVAAWRRDRLQFAAVMLLFAVGAGMGLRRLPTESWTRIVTIREEVQGGTLGDRVQIWRAGLAAFERHPVIGVGPGGFKAAVAPALHNRAAAHNTLLSIGVELGVIGLVVFLLVLCASLVALARAPPLERWLGWGLMLTWGVGSSALSWDYNKATWYVVLVCAALGAVDWGRVVRRPSHEEAA